MSKIEVVPPLKISSIFGEPPLKSVEISLSSLDDFLDKLTPDEETVALAGVKALVERREAALGANIDLMTALTKVIADQESGNQ